MKPIKPEKLLADALPHGLIVLDEAYSLQWYNCEGARLLGLNEENESEIADFFKEQRFVNFLQKNNSSQLELPSPQKPAMQLSFYWRPYLANQKIVVIQDITPRCRLERMREDFIANVSHELRTPLTVFRGYLEMLLSNTSLPQADYLQVLTQMDGQRLRMERLVQDLLLLSRLESAEPEPEKHERVDIPSLIHQVHQEALSIGKEQQHEFHLEVDESLNLRGETHELRSAFTNLVVNAVRYTPEKGSILLKWYQDGKGKHFEVKDSGIGIEAKHLERITQRFYRVDKARSREMGGTGLGLAIVKHVLLRHQGELSIESIPQVGSLFRCTFSG